MKIKGRLSENSKDKKYLALVNALREKYKTTDLGVGSFGIAFDLGEGKALKVTTDSYEIDHAIKLKGHSSPFIIPILGVKRFSEKLGVIYTKVADPISDQEKIQIKEIEDSAEDFLSRGDDKELNKFTQNTDLVNFVKGLKAAFNSAGISGDEIDWSPENIMRYKGTYALVDI